MHQSNIYGDSLDKPLGNCGSDISSQRLDTLDYEAILYALQLKAGSHHDKSFTLPKTLTALDLGCGLGVQSIRLASLGWHVTAIDRNPIEMTHITNDLLKWLPMSYIKKDAQTIAKKDLNEFSMVYSQRFLHYLKYDEAKKLLTLIVKMSHPHARFFLSVSGIDSELGTNYHRSQITKRFCNISTQLQVKHGITNPVCLYSMDEFLRLTKECGLNSLTTFPSAFGNIKGIFFK